MLNNVSFKGTIILTDPALSKLQNGSVPMINAYQTAQKFANKYPNDKNIYLHAGNQGGYTGYGSDYTIHAIVVDKDGHTSTSNPIYSTDYVPKKVERFLTNA